MFVTKSIVHGYSSELANLSYDVEIGNGLKIKIKPSDLLLFIDNYIPELSSMAAAFIQPVLTYKNVQEANALYHHLSYQLNAVMEPVFTFPLRELNFDFSTNSMEYDSFVEFKETLKYVEFLEVAASIIPKLREEKPHLFVDTVFEPVSFIFEKDQFVYTNDDYDIVIKNSVIETLKSRIVQDFKTMGEQTLAWLGNIEEKSYVNFVPVEFFINNFENDVLELKNKDIDYTDFCIFLNKYKLTENS